MNRADISNTLDSLHPELSQLNDKAEKSEKAAISDILNLVETLVAQVDELEKEKQSLKDEINRLKGEQGKPDIKANKKQDGDISSENERRDAEETDEDKAKKIGFKLDKSSLEKLKEQRLPVQLLEQLEALQGHKYLNKIEFIYEIEARIGSELTDENRDLLLQYGRYKKRNRQAKIPKITINRRENCPVDRSQLPEDAVLKDHEYKVVQDVTIKTNNVEFKREVYYSPALRKCYIGPVPEGYDKGDFGPNINADILSFKYVNGMTIPKIVEFYENIGIFISGSYISTRTTDPVYMDVFHHEKSEAFKAAIEVSSYLQIDDTGSRVNGQNHYTQILCNDLFTAFFTTQYKNRLTILDILRHFVSKHFLLNQKTFELLEQLGVSKTDQHLLSAYQRDTSYNEADMLGLLNALYADRFPQKRTRILEACAISCYRQETGIAIVSILVCDDAAQFKLLTDLLALCWVHNGRHYKRLNPLVTLHQEKLADFLQAFWGYYRKLALYKSSPDEAQAIILDKEFDRLFSTETGYDDLDARIKKTRAQKEELLVVLKHPEVPLHNNLSEGGAKIEKRKQDVSFQTITLEGTRSKDTMMSIVETCKKLGISAYKFIQDRIKGTHIFPTLAEMIKAKAAGQPIPI